MYPDWLHEAIGIKNYLGWILLAYSYATFDIIYNWTMCFLVGGSQRIIRFYKKLCRVFPSTKKSKKKTLKDKFDTLMLNTPKYLRIFKKGSVLRLAEYREDILWWLWPVTTLAFPLAIYGISRNLIENNIKTLRDLGINTEHYFVFDQNYVQFLILGIAISIGISTFFRYRHNRSERTWFSKSVFFHLSRIILFDIPLAYAIINTILLWLSFLLPIYKILLNHSFTYSPLQPDLMYGLSSIHSIVVGMGAVLIAFSFLPTVMLIREKNEKYNRMYYILWYGGLLIATILFGVLMILFSNTLTSIQKNALAILSQQIGELNQLGNTPENTQKLLSAYLWTNVSSLPTEFTFPTWIKSIFNIRLIVLIYEILKLITPPTKFKPNTMIEKVLQLISDFLK